MNAGRRGLAALRSQHVIPLAALVGVLTGLGVAAFEEVVNEQGFQRVIELPNAVQYVLPVAGLVVAALALRYLAGRASPATADEYIRSFHERDRRLDLRPVAGRLVAGAATLGSGCPMGYEGPSIYLGASTGSLLQRRLSRYFSREDAKVLLVAGAAAGVAAIFKAPATGAVFALEVPYQGDLARRMLLPCLFSAAASYVTFAAFKGTTPLLPVAGSPPFDFRDLGGAALVGLSAGLAARLFAMLLFAAKRRAARGNPFVRAAVAGALVGAIALIGQWVSGESLVLGPGYRSIQWSLQPSNTIAAVLALLVLRAVATAAAVGGGGAGGLFVPLVVQGALLGRVVAGVVHSSRTTLFPVLGVAAFLGAGYHVPLAAVMFVAESTGRPGFVVPGLVAAAAAQLAVGRQSVSPYQQAARLGHLERRFALPVRSVVRTDAATVPPDATVAEVFEQQVVQSRLQLLPVVEGAVYLGMIHLADLTEVPREKWEQTLVSEIMRADGPAAQIESTLGQVLAEMERADVDRLPVVDQGRFVGMVATGEILKLDEILETMEGEG